MMCVSGVCVCGVCIWCGVCLMYSMYMFCGLCVGCVCMCVCGGSRDEKLKLDCELLRHIQDRGRFVL